MQQSQYLLRAFRLRFDFAALERLEAALSCRFMMIGDLRENARRYARAVNAAAQLACWFGTPTLAPMDSRGDATPKRARAWARTCHAHYFCCRRAAIPR